MARKTGQRVAEKKAQILAGAKEILIRKGRQIRMGDIAEAVGMETSSLYYYFKGIPEVLDALLKDKYRDLSEYGAEVDQADGPAIDTLRELVLYLLEFYHENLGSIQIIMSHVSPLFQDPDLEEDTEAINDYLNAYRNADKVLLHCIRRAQEGDEITSDRPPEVLLSVLRGAMWGLIASWRTHYPAREEIPGCIDRLFQLLTYSNQN